MKARHQIGILGLTLAVLLSSCQAAAPSATTSSSDTASETGPVATSGTGPVSSTPGSTSTAGVEWNVGNSNRNYANQGIYVENEEWVWFSDREDDYRLNRMKPDGSGLEKFEATGVIGKNLVGDDLYFVQRADREEDGMDMAGLIYRMGPDEKVGTLVSPIRVNFAGAFMIVEDEIFFTNAVDGDRLYRMKLDGSGATKLSDLPSWGLNAEDGWIFYLLSKEDQSLTLHRMRPDGSEDSLFLDLPDAMFIASAGWLYHKDADGHLLRTNYDKTRTQEVIAAPVSTFTVQGDVLFYTSQTRHLMNANLDGSEPGVLLDREVIGIQLAGDWLYLMDSQRHLFRMKRDGTGLEKAYSLPMVAPDPSGTPVVQGLGAINANLGAGSMFAEDEDGVYYVKFGEGILRMKPDGTGQTMILDHWVSRLNLVGGWLYFIDQDAYGSIARIRTDGSDYGVIHDASVGELIVRDNWIYFAGQEGWIFRIRTDGTELGVISEGLLIPESNGVATRLSLDGDWLYWSGSLDDPWTSQGICKTKIDGSEEGVLEEGPIRSLTVDEEYILYIPSSRDERNDAVWRMTLEGTGAETIIPQDTITLAGVYRGWLYYYDGMEEAGLFRSHLDGSERHRLVGPGNYVWVHFLDDRIIFFDNGQETFRMMDLDGANIRDFEEALPK